MPTCAISTQRLPRINGSYSPQRHPRPRPCVIALRKWLQAELRTPSIRKKIIDRNSKISSTYVLVKYWVNSRARLTHDYYWSPPIVCHFPSRGLSNTNIRRGAINEKSFPTNNPNRVAETESAKHIPGYILVLYGILVFGVEVLGLQKGVSIWPLPCNAVFIIDTSLAVDPEELWIF